jgi:hypothetical protein
MFTTKDTKGTKMDKKPHLLADEKFSNDSPAATK